MHLIVKDNITDTQYLRNFLRCSKKSYNDYETFSTSSVIMQYNNIIISEWEHNAIDILPYIFTVESLSFDAFFKFLIFVGRYLSKCEICNDILTSYIQKTILVRSNAHALLDILNESTCTKKAILLIMQYYFL
jgi:hypothetical protein